MTFWQGFLLGMAGAAVTVVLLVTALVVWVHWPERKQRRGGQQ